MIAMTPMQRYLVYIRGFKLVASPSRTDSVGVWCPPLHITIITITIMVYRRWMEGESQKYRSDLKLLCNDRPNMNIESEQQMQASVISWVVTVSSEWSDRKWEQVE